MTEPDGRSIPDEAEVYLAGFNQGSADAALIHRADHHGEAVDPDELQAARERARLSEGHDDD